MSNSNHCAGRTLSFKSIKAYNGPKFGKNMLLCVNFRHILANFILKWTKISHFKANFILKWKKICHILFIVYSFESDSVA